MLAECLERRPAIGCDVEIAAREMSGLRLMARCIGAAMENAVAII
jgi:hypothetical protein